MVRSAHSRTSRGSRQRRAETGAARRAPSVARVLAAMRRALAHAARPSVSEIAHRDRDPFRILVSTLLSLRTKDEVTDAASARLFAKAATPHALAHLDPRTIERAIYPVGFYRTKARTIRAVARRIEDEYDGRVPDSIDELLTFKGVGRKTAALVVSLGYGRPAICVDTHVHRISNRLAWVTTRTPAETESALMEIVPRRLWIGINETLVGFGQRVCTPTSPHCTTCPVRGDCPRVGVGRSR